MDKCPRSFCSRSVADMPGLEPGVRVSAQGTGIGVHLEQGHKMESLNGPPPRQAGALAGNGRCSRCGREAGLWSVLWEIFVGAVGSFRVYVAFEVDARTDSCSCSCRSQITGHSVSTLGQTESKSVVSSRLFGLLRLQFCWCNTACEQEDLAWLLLK